MFLRKLIAILLLPGVVAFLVPIAILWASGTSRSPNPGGLLLIIIGLSGLMMCIRDFRVIGRGTLAPWNPPEHLVTVGLYRHSRNPMYIAVAVMVFGWAAAFGSPGLMVYAVVVTFTFHLRVVYGEEPALARRFGDEWAEYSGRVPRWFGKVKPSDRN